MVHPSAVSIRRSGLRATQLLASALLILGADASCSQKAAPTGPAPDDAEAPVLAPATPDAPPLAANEANVSRFPDEKPLGSVAATLARAANIREIPGVGKIVVSLSKGASVTEIAQRANAFLVVVESPLDKQKLMGWVTQDAFSAAPKDGGPKVPTCKAPEVPLTSDAPFCGRICARDADCVAGQTCRGVANTFVGAKVGDTVAVCVVAPPPPPTKAAPPVTTAGKSGNPPSSAPAAAAPDVPAPPTTTGGLPSCDEQIEKEKTCRSSARCVVKPRTPCVTLPRNGRANGVTCSSSNNCSSGLCRNFDARGFNGTCTACKSAADCSNFVCANGRCTDERAGGDDGDETPSASRNTTPSSGSKKPEPKGNGASCSHDSDCASTICGTITSPGGNHKCGSKR